MSRFAQWRSLPDGSLSQDEVCEMLDELEPLVARADADRLDAQRGDTRMNTILTIYSTRNGWVLEYEADDGDYTTTESVPKDDVELLWSIADRLCVLGSRYDPKRLFIGTKPGDKHHDLHPGPCSECECGCDPDMSQP